MFKLEALPGDLPSSVRPLIAKIPVVPPIKKDLLENHTKDSGVDLESTARSSASRVSGVSDGSTGSDLSAQIAWTVSQILSNAAVKAHAEISSDFNLRRTRSISSIISGSSIMSSELESTISKILINAAKQAQAEINGHRVVTTLDEYDPTYDTSFSQIDAVACFPATPKKETFDQKIRKFIASLQERVMKFRKTKVAPMSTQAAPKKSGNFLLNLFKRNKVVPL